MDNIKVIQSEQIQFNTDPRDPKITCNQVQTLPDQARTIIRVHEQQEAESVQTYVSEYRPDDFAVACADVAKELFGITLQAGSGFRPAETKRVAVSLTETREVPWGQNEIPALEGAQMVIDTEHNPEKGLLGRVRVYAKNKFTPVVKEFFDRIGQRLQTHSIYRGKAIVGTDYPEFYDIGWFRPELVTHSDLVSKALDVFLFTRLRHREQLGVLGESFGAKVLTHGPYGSGKTSTFLLAATEAAKHGIGAVIHRTGVDDVYDTLRTAKLYAPCIVLVEDIDVIAHRNLRDRELQRLLEALDGTTSKGAGVVIFMTTNHRKDIHKGALRPGRIDLELEINELDRSGVEKLVRGHVGQLLADDVDFDAIYDTTVVGGVPTFTGSHVESMVRHVRMAGLHRTGKTVFDLTTEDFIAAAAPVKLQQRLQAEAKGADKPPAIESAIEAAVARSVNQIVESDEFRETLTDAACYGSRSVVDDIRYHMDESNQRAIDNTVLMDPDKYEVKGALDVQ